VRFPTFYALRVRFITRHYIIEVSHGARKKAPYSSVGCRNPTALWRLRASTSNRLSDQSRPHLYTQIRQIYRIYAQRDIRGCVDDHYKLHCGQSSHPTALWQPRVSTSNRLSDHSRPQTHTHMRYIDRIYAQRDTRGYGDDHFEPPRAQFRKSTAL